MTAASVSRELPLGFLLAVGEQGAASTIERDGQWDLARQAARVDAIARVLAGRLACLLLGGCGPRDSFDPVSGGSEGANSAA